MTNPTTVDLVFEALADQRRRQLCETLASKNEAVDMATLAKQLHEQRRLTSSTSSRQRLEIQLHHVHLPLLDDANVVEYCPSAKRVEPAPNLQIAATLLETATDETREPAA